MVYKQVYGIEDYEKLKDAKIVKVELKDKNESNDCEFFVNLHFDNGMKLELGTYQYYNGVDLFEKEK